MIIIERILSVYELNTFLKNNIEENEYLKNIYVTGEISNLVFSKSGHVYFSLKDEQSTINCMIWKSNAHKLQNLSPKDGMKINVVGRVTYYVPGGRISLEVRDVKVEGIGELQQIYEKRYKELKELGWFNETLKKPLPKYPKNIGIITADTGAAVHDLITTISRRWPIASIFLFPSQVQGDGAALEIKQKIIQANNFSTKLDVLIVGRGGGSYEDLWQFNELPVLEGIKNSSIPIISAVGHEPDITLSDYVADKRAATPTAAGEIATPSLAEIKKDLLYKYNNLKNLIASVYKNKFNILNNNYQKLITNINHKSYINQKTIEQYFITLEKTIESLYKTNNNYLNKFYLNIINAMNLIIQKDENKINQLYKMANIGINNIYTTNELQLGNMIKTLNLINPKKPLEKGYALIVKNGKVLEANDKINVNDNLTITRNKEKIDVEVKNIYEKGENNYGSK